MGTNKTKDAVRKQRLQPAFSNDPIYGVRKYKIKSTGLKAKAINIIH